MINLIYYGVLIKIIKLYNNKITKDKKIFKSADESYDFFKNQFINTIIDINDLDKKYKEYNKAQIYGGFKNTVIKKPITKKLVTKKPLSKKEVTKKPVTKKSVTTKTVTKKPVTKKPVTKKPVTNEPIHK
jgi:hypothetical protein